MDGLDVEVFEVGDVQSKRVFNVVRFCGGGYQSCVVNLFD
jgi:hypothetical protein